MKFYLDGFEIANVNIRLSNIPRNTERFLRSMIGLASFIGLMDKTTIVQAIPEAKNISITNPAGSSLIIKTYLRHQEIQTMLESGICGAKALDPTQDSYKKITSFCMRQMLPGRSAPRVNALTLYAKSDIPPNDNFILCIHRFLIEECNEDSKHLYKNGIIYFSIMIPVMILLYYALQYRHKITPIDAQNHSDILINTAFSRQLEKIKLDLAALQNEEKENDDIKKLEKDILTLEGKFNCPGTKPKQLINIPITMSTGVTYDKKYIVTAFKNNNYTCPKTQNLFTETLNTLPAVDVIVKNDIRHSLEGLQQRINLLQIEPPAHTSATRKMQ